MTAPTLVFALCSLTSIVCALLLARAYLRTRRRLLLWCAACFALMALNATVTLVDMWTLPLGNMLPYRQLASLGAVVVLIYGFIWEAE